MLATVDGLLKKSDVLEPWGEFETIFQNNVYSFLINHEV